jgi:hypothetical protein
MHNFKPRDQALKSAILHLSVLKFHSKQLYSVQLSSNILHIYKVFTTWISIAFCLHSTILVDSVVQNH